MNVDETGRVNGGVGSLFKAAAGDYSSPRNNDKYDIRHNEAYQKLWLKCEGYTLSVSVGTDFDLPALMNRFATLEVSSSRPGSSIESYRRFMESEYGIHKGTANLNWGDIRSCLREDNYIIIYKNLYTYIMARKESASDGEFVWVYCAEVMSDVIQTQEYFIFPVEFLMERISGM